MGGLEPPTGYPSVTSLRFSPDGAVLATTGQGNAQGSWVGLWNVAKGTLIHESLRGLEPGVEYVSFLYEQNKTCASGIPTTEVMRFTANPAGIATFNTKVDVELSQIGSISVQRVSDNTLLACASVTP